MEQGLLHLYWGDGKGKTTAAMGLALRALGSGKRVVIVQFLKSGNSGEIPLLAQLGAEIYRGKAGQKFVFQMTPEEKAATRELQNQNLAASMAQPADLLILDEAGSAEELDMVDVDLLKKAVLERPAGCECVLTAHTPPQWMLDAADYSTEMPGCDPERQYTDTAGSGNQRKRVCTGHDYLRLRRRHHEYAELYAELSLCLPSPGKHGGNVSGADTPHPVRLPAL